MSFQGYYRWLNRLDTQNDILNRQLVDAMYELEKIHLGNLGVQRMTMYLNDEYDWGHPINHKRVRRLMGLNGIESNIRRNKYNHKQREEQYLAEHVMNQDFTTTGPNQKWSSDMTELTYGLNREHSFKLSAVLDLYGDYVLSYNISETETTAAAIQTFHRVFIEAGNPTEVLVHTDRGSAYTSHQFNHFMAAHNAQRSMSRPGTPYDNAMVEKLWNDFKLEWWDKQVVITMKDAVKAIKAGIDYFNYMRRSKTRNGLTPYEYRNEAIYGGNYA